MLFFFMRKERSNEERRAKKDRARTTSKAFFSADVADDDDENITRTCECEHRILSSEYPPATQKDSSPIVLCASSLWAARDVPGTFLDVVRWDINPKISNCSCSRLLFFHRKKARDNFPYLLTKEKQNRYGRDTETNGVAP